MEMDVSLIITAATFVLTYSTVLVKMLIYQNVKNKGTDMKMIELENKIENGFKNVDLIHNKDINRLEKIFEKFLINSEKMNELNSEQHNELLKNIDCVKIIVNDIRVEQAKNNK